MKYITLFLLSLFLIGCKEEEIIPTCDFITVIHDTDNLSLTIYSEEPSITICRELPKRTECLTVLSNYYGCISLGYFPNEIFYVYSDKGVCTFTAK